MIEAPFKNNEMSVLRTRYIDSYLRGNGRFDSHFVGRNIARWIEDQSVADVPHYAAWQQCFERVAEDWHFPLWRDAAMKVMEGVLPKNLLSRFCIPVNPVAEEDTAESLTLYTDSDVPVLHVVRALSKQHTTYLTGRDYLVLFPGDGESEECLVRVVENGAPYEAALEDVLPAILAVWHGARMSEKWLAARLFLVQWIREVHSVLLAEAGVYFAAAVAIADDETGDTVHADRVLVYKDPAVTDTVGCLHDAEVFRGQNKKIRKPTKPLLTCANIAFDFDDFFRKAMIGEPFADHRDERIADALRRRGKFMGHFNDGSVFAVQPEYCPQYFDPGCPVCYRDGAIGDGMP